MTSSFRNAVLWWGVVALMMAAAEVESGYAAPLGVAAAAVAMRAGWLSWRVLAAGWTRVRGWWADRATGRTTTADTGEEAALLACLAEVLPEGVAARVASPRPGTWWNDRHWVELVRNDAPIAVLHPAAADAWREERARFEPLWRRYRTSGVPVVLVPAKRGYAPSELRLYLNEVLETQGSELH